MKKVTPKNFEQVLDNFKNYMKQMKDNKDNGSLKHTCQALNEFLDDLSSQDAFGTEGQLDPRGDQRD